MAPQSRQSGRSGPPKLPADKELKTQPKFAGQDQLRPPAEPTWTSPSLVKTTTLAPITGQYPVRSSTALAELQIIASRCDSPRASITRVFLSGSITSAVGGKILGGSLAIRKSDSERG